MPRANFCAECGERLAHKGWRARLWMRLCESCGRRIGLVAILRPPLIFLIVVLAAFAFGRYLRPPAPPLIIQRQASSPLSDAPLVFGQKRSASLPNQSQPPSAASEEGYICGARTQKGAPCKRRVHTVGERCFQHKGLPAMVPAEKLVIRPANSTK